MYIKVHIHTHVYVHIYMHMHKCMCIQAYLYTHTHTLTHIFVGHLFRNIHPFITIPLQPPMFTHSHTSSKKRGVKIMAIDIKSLAHTHTHTHTSCENCMKHLCGFIKSLFLTDTHHDPPHTQEDDNAEDVDEARGEHPVPCSKQHRLRDEEIGLPPWPLL